MFTELKKDQKSDDFVATYRAYATQPFNFRANLKINALWRAMDEQQQRAALKEICPGTLADMDIFGGRVVEWS